MANLAAQVFSVLRDTFFDVYGKPVAVQLREKSNTQDDPFDEYIAKTLDDKLKEHKVRCQRAPGPLISPDMVVYSDKPDISISEIGDNPDLIIGIEVKKLERDARGSVARASGMDYNSTPPCGRIRIYSADDEPLEIKGFYLFACLEEVSRSTYIISAMTLCDGSILNDDFDLYMQITGAREKGINLGTYGDGANRQRPMLIFSNPLGAELLDHKTTLISGVNLGISTDSLLLTWRIIRKDVHGKEHVFYVYQDKRDVESCHVVTDQNDPFPTPKKRVSETRGRGKFKVNRRYEGLKK